MSKRCPYCAEEILDAAIVCKHCRRDLRPGAAQVQPVKATRKTSPAAMGCLIVLLMFLGFCVYVAIPSKTRPTTSSVSVVSPPPAPANDPDLPAKVNFNGTQFAITNEGTLPWTNAKATVNGSFTQQIGAVAPGKKVTVGAMTFAKSDGTRFNPFQMKPQKFVLTATMNGKTAIYVGGWQ